MGKHIVLVGAGHAHLMIISRITSFHEKGHRISVVSESPYHYYSGMGPGMLSGIYAQSEVRFNVKLLTETSGGYFINQKVTSVKPENKHLVLDNGMSVPYDIVSFNTGSTVSGTLSNFEGNNVFPVKPVENLNRARGRVLDSAGANSLRRFVIIGGGAAGVEIAANLARLLSDIRSDAEISVITGGSLLNRFTPSVKSTVKYFFQNKKIHIYENSRVRRILQASVELDDGSNHYYDLAFVATGITASPMFYSAGLSVSRNSGLRVNRFLQSTVRPEIFGAGDCIDFEPSSLPKIGVYAVRQSPVLFNNLHSFCEGKPLSSFKPQKKYILILNMGDGTGILIRGSLIIKGRTAFLIKDYIDRKFMNQYRVVDNDS